MRSLMLYASFTQAVDLSVRGKLLARLCATVMQWYVNVVDIINERKKGIRVNLEVKTMWRYMVPGSLASLLF